MGRYENGWTKRYRNELASLGYHGAALFNALVGMANRFPNEAERDGDRVLIERGQVWFSLRKFCLEHGLSKSTIKRLLNRLEKLDRIRTTSGPHGFFVSIVNYDEYSDDLPLAGPQVDHFRPVNGVKNKNKNNTLSDLTLDSTRPKKSKANEYTPEFERLYSKYPRKEGKKSGFKIFRSLSGEDVVRLEQAIDKYAKAVKAEKRESRHIKMFGTFMNCWEDYAAPAVAAQSSFLTDDDFADIAIQPKRENVRLAIAQSLKGKVGGEE